MLGSLVLGKSGAVLFTLDSVGLHVGADDQIRVLLTFENLHGGAVNQDLFSHNKDSLYSVTVSLGRL